MSVIIGLINKGRIIISADTMLANLQDTNMNRHGFKKIYSFELDDNKYLIGAAGLATDLDKFLKIIQKHEFRESFYTPNVFAVEMQSILKIDSINNLTLLIGGYDKQTANIIRVNVTDLNTINQENSYLVLSPDSTMNKSDELNHFIKIHAELLTERPLDFLRVIQKEIALIDNYRYVNDDFYCETLTSNLNIEKQQTSDKGYKMN